MYGKAVGPGLFYANYCLTYLFRETLYRNFILEYSVSEDRITALWGKIHIFAVKYRVCLGVYLPLRFMLSFINRMGWKISRRMQLHNKRSSKKSK